MNEPIKEKVLSGKKIGMPVLFFTVLLYLAAIGLTIYGAVLAEEGGSSLLMIVGIVWLCIGWLPAPGLKVLKPQEALVLTLFGKYVGTLKGEGFYFVNPFCSAVNPAAKTQLNQSGDVKAASTPIKTENGTPAVTLADHDPEQQPSEGERLPGQPRGDRYRRDVACGGYRQGGVPRG